MGQCSTQDAVGPQLPLRGLTFGDSVGSEKMVGKMQRVLHFLHIFQVSVVVPVKQWQTMVLGTHDFVLNFQNV